MKNDKKPKIRFKGFDDDWEQRKWVDSVDISTEMVDPTSSEYADMPHIAPGNIESFTGRILDNVKMVKEEQLISGKFRFRPDDVVYGKINPQLGKYFYASVDGLTSADAYVFKGKNGTTQKFLFSLLQTNEFFKYSVSVSKRSGMPKINRDELNAYRFFSPNEEEQDKIGDLLLGIGHLITLHQRKCDKLQKIKKSMLEKMFPQNESKKPEIRFKGFNVDWEQRKLGEVSESYSGGTPSVGNKSYYVGSIPFIRSAEINSESTELFLTEEGLTNSSARMVSKGDILYALYGATSGETGRSRINGAINQAILAILPHDGYDSEFLMQWLRKSKQNITDIYLQGGQGNLSGTIVKALEVNFPSLAEQRQIGNYFQSLDNLITLHQRELEKMKYIKKSMLEKMFV